MLFEETCATTMFKAMGKIAFFTIMMDSPTVHQALASSAWHQAWLNGEHIKSAEHLPHQIAAIQCVNDKLAHPIVGISDETIGLVVAFSCQAVSVTPNRNPQRNLILLVDHGWGL
jgi:hypothetical protein